MLKKTFSKITNILTGTLITIDYLAILYSAIAYRGSQTLLDKGPPMETFPNIEQFLIIATQI